MKDYPSFNNSSKTISELSCGNSSFNGNKNLGIQIDDDNDFMSYFTDSSIGGLSNQGEPTDDDNFYNPLPLNKNNLYNSNLVSGHNSTSQIIENYRNNVLKNYKTELNIPITTINTSYISPEPSRPGSTLNNVVLGENTLQNSTSVATESVCRKKPHIEDLIDLASNINSTLKHKEFGGSLMGNTTSSAFYNHVASDMLSTHSIYQKINESDIKKYEFPLTNNFVQNRTVGIQYYIDQYFNIVDKSIIRNNAMHLYKDIICSEEITDLINNKTMDECIDALITIVENTKLISKPLSLSKIYKLTEPTISFTEYLKKRVCSKLDKGTVISAIVQMKTVYNDFKINADEQHKFIMSVLKINYKLNNDILEISNNTFSKMVGMKISALNACEMELIRMIK